MTLVVGFGHKARNGKDTCVEAVIQYYGDRRAMQVRHGLTIAAPKAQRISFAEALYEEARVLHGMTEKDPELLQRIGSERRAEDENYWIKRAFAKVGPYTDIVLVSDMRYKNEAYYIKSLGGYIVDVERLHPNGVPFIAADRPADHPSEIDLDGYNFDFYIKVKSGHLALLQDSAITLVEYLRGLHD